MRYVLTTPKLECRDDMLVFLFKKNKIGGNRTMATMQYKFNSNFNYYYLNGKFYRSGEGEWNPNESFHNEWIITK